MRALLACVVALTLAAAASATDRVVVGEYADVGSEQQTPGPIWGGARNVLWDNGPIVNYEPDLSMLQTVTFSVNFMGYGHQFIHQYWVSDDFTIPDGDFWNIDAITFFAFQVGSGLTSTITGYHVIIYDGDPMVPGANIVYGDATTNVLQSTDWSGVYRVSESFPGSTSYPIMANVCDVNVTLGGGHYWIAWQADGTVDNGPWVPPISIWDQPETGDGMQSSDDGATWYYLVDDELGEVYQQGLPFIISDSEGSPVESASWTAIKSLYR